MLEIERFRCFELKIEESEIDSLSKLNETVVSQWKKVVICFLVMSLLGCFTLVLVFRVQFGPKNVLTSYGLGK